MKPHVGDHRAKTGSGDSSWQDSSLGDSGESAGFPPCVLSRDMHGEEKHRCLEERGTVTVVTPSSLAEL